MTIPGLKPAVWDREGDRLRLLYDVRELLVITDPDGTAEALLELLREGGRSVDELTTELQRRDRDVTAAEVTDAVELLDSQRLLENERQHGQIDAASKERYFSNLAFFEAFADLAHGKEDYQQALREAHVLVLGTGGFNSNVIPHLCGLGVGRLTLLDRDTVKMRNFARQYLYLRSDLGARKVLMAAEWVRRFDPDIKVEAVDAGVDCREDVAALLDRYTPDVVMSGVDHPRQVDSWVNSACVARGVPYVRAGMRVTQGAVWSVDPGVSACRACAELAQATGSSRDLDADEQVTAAELYGRQPRRNRGIGPVAGLLGAFSAFEVLRYLTGYEPPAYAGRPLMIDFLAGCAVTQPPAWPRRPDCPVCSDKATATG